MTTKGFYKVFSVILTLAFKCCIAVDDGNSSSSSDIPENLSNSTKQFEYCVAWGENVIVSNQTNHDSNFYLNHNVSDFLSAECGFKNHTKITGYLGTYPLVTHEYDIGNIEIMSSNISEFQQTYFCGLPILWSLILIDNQLDDISKVGLGIYDGCEVINQQCNYEIQELRLDKNPIKVVRNTSLCLLKNLTELRLRNCELEMIEEGAFKYNVNLRNLFLVGNRLKVIPPIGHLNRLKQLDIASNLLTSIKNDDLKNTISLIYFDLSYNQINNIEDHAFDNLLSIRYLNISHNRVKNISKPFKDLNVNTLDISYNQLNEILTGLFSPYLEILIATDNVISKIYGPLSMKEINLKQLDLRRNNLTVLPDLRVPYKMEIFDLSHNNISTFYFNSIDIELREKVEIRYFPVTKLINNSIEILFFQNVPADLYELNDNPLACNCENAWLFNNNSSRKNQLIGKSCKQVSKFNPNNISKLSSDMLCESNYNNSNRCTSNREITISKSGNILEQFNCKFQCPFNCYCYTTQHLLTVHLYCSNTKSVTVPEFFNPQSIDKNAKIIVWLNGNNFPNVKSDNFSDYFNVKEMYLYNSNIGTIDQMTFQIMTDVEIIDLRNNHLTTLPLNLFDNLKSLKKLFLSGNKLKLLHKDIFKQTTSLQFLYLHDNNLSNFPVWAINDTISLKQLTLHRNIWSCECDFIVKFNEFLLAHLSTVLNVNDIYCNYTNGTVSSSPVVKYDISLCKIIINYIMWSSIAAACVLLLVATVLLFIYRFEVRVLLYAKLKVRILKRWSTEESEGKIFDAFIAYSSEDSDFLRDEILPKLEEIENPFNICLHERNFLAGGAIMDTILEAVKLSSRTIIILTDKFVNSGWCMYEFKAAHMQMMLDRCPRVLLIVKDDIPDEIDPQLKMYIKTNTYLKWGETLFWEKLYYAMPNQRVQQITEEPSPFFTTTM
ncbi:defense response [Chamberlinius hualienensis]